ncbi:MAG: hypothetical protein WC379_10460 [Methanoregula sp.]
MNAIVAVMFINTATLMLSISATIFFVFIDTVTPKQKINAITR